MIDKEPFVRQAAIIRITGPDSDQVAVMELPELEIVPLSVPGDGSTR